VIFLLNLFFPIFLQDICKACRWHNQEGDELATTTTTTTTATTTATTSTTTTITTTTIYNNNNNNNNIDSSFQTCLTRVGGTIHSSVSS
jgi:hypothetical protein